MRRLAPLALASLLSSRALAAEAEAAAPAPEAAAEEAPADPAPSDLVPPDATKGAEVTPEAKRAMEAMIERFGDRPEVARTRDLLGQIQRDAIGPEGSDPILRRAAGRFFFSLVRADVGAALQESRAPFQLEGEALPTDAELKRRLQRLLDPRPLQGMLVYGIEVLPLAEMTTRHGAPPARLGAIPPDAWIGVANVGGNALVAVFTKDARGAWKAVAFTD